VVACLFRGDATGWIVDKHHLQQVETSVAEIIANWVVMVALPLGKGSLEVRV